ncbi:hypothetical protein BDW60DRAFT_208841 [Aspergillus nidulans var. acristatus]
MFSIANHLPSPFNPLLVEITGGLFTGQQICSFFQPANIYEELGLPTEDGGEGKTQTVSPFVYFKAIYELGLGLNLLTPHHARQYQADDYVDSDERVHASGFRGYCVWKYGGPR